MSLIRKLKRLLRLLRVRGPNFLKISDQIADSKILSAKILLIQLGGRGV